MTSPQKLHLVLTALALALLTEVGVGADVQLRQLTFGSRHHFFGYIGQSLTVPWNRSGDKVLSLRTDFHDRMPTAKDAAEIVLVDTRSPKVEPVTLTRTRAWNFQQGTMLYWHPKRPDTRFFFNDRDPDTGKVFTAMFDVPTRSRVQVFRDPKRPTANSGVSPIGDKFLAINYGRLARLRPVTGYPEAFDWTVDVAAPEDDGIFIIDVASGDRSLLVSYKRLASELRKKQPSAVIPPLFINHTLWNREGNLIYFFVRGGWNRGSRAKRVNVACSVRPDGSGLLVGHLHAGGHPEWGEKSQLIGRSGERQVIYDVLKRRIVGSIGSPETIPNPEGDISLSPSGRWLANGYVRGNRNHYLIASVAGPAVLQLGSIPRGNYASELRIDPAPRWNWTNDRILVPGIAENGFRQLFEFHIRW
ncbi:MAG: hypothetical protein ACYSWU_06935 [Planctomycetota bacterium]|jgi:hypothetical protein